MKNWDPLSIFKYLTGGPTIHLSMFVLLYRCHHTFDELGPNRPLYKDDKPDSLYNIKRNLIHNMIDVHMACFIVHMLFEGGVY